MIQLALFFVRIDHRNETIAAFHMGFLIHHGFFSDLCL